MTTLRLRCAIYTRKSSEEGLKQDFNSLDAQREACAAYVLSQAGEGWTAIPTVYDDGGYSGGNMERPALKALMSDIERRLVDIVVVYKVDRLTRSLTDFGRIVETFDAKGVSFVSVTQAFNTTTSMGRLTLNVLLSFAQFEREVTGERIRDKIAASKAKGLWMGGNVPMGYEADGRTLKVVPEDAEIVRGIYRRYLELGSVHLLRDELEAEGVRSKVRTSLEGVARGGAAIGRSALFHMLANRTYLGEVPHKGAFYTGLHPPLIDPELFEAVQAKLMENAGPKRRSAAGLALKTPASPLAGLLRDDRGNTMSPVSARGSQGQRYRYYTSSALQSGRRGEAGSEPRVSAKAIEELVVEQAVRLGLSSDWASLRSQIVSVELGRRHLRITFFAGPVPGYIALYDDGCSLVRDERHVVLTVATMVKRRGGAKTMTGPPGQSAIAQPSYDAVLIRALARAEAWRRALLANNKVTMGSLATNSGVDESYVQRLLRLAFLASDLKRGILDGRQPVGLTLQRFMRNDLPLDWAEQRAFFRI